MPKENEMILAKKMLGSAMGLVGLIWAGLEYGYALPIILMLILWGNNLEKNGKNA